MKMRLTFLVLIVLFATQVTNAFDLDLSKLKNNKGDIDKTYLFQNPQGTIDVNSGKKGKFELGLRFLTEVGIDATINLSKNRIHITGTFVNNFRLAFYYDWIFAINSAPGLAVYAGLGFAVQFEDYRPFGIGGNFGIQYAFTGAPIAIGFDWRPTGWFGDGSAFKADDVAFMVRFQF